MADIKVSILCLTYNHKEYIRDAIEGFLKQKTDFEYEIIVHDDASTDGTTEILKEYESCFPKKIRLLLEKENQYSKGVRILDDILYPMVKGKYIALCEGDDYWIYDRKLQKQYQLMESHPEVSLCYHNALILQEETDELALNIVNHSSDYIADRDIICTTKGWYSTASAFYRTEYLKNKPCLRVSTGDEALRGYMACCGKLYFINRAWSVYRKFSKESWNTRYSRDKCLAIEHLSNTIVYCQEFNQFSCGRFEAYIEERLFSAINKYRYAYYGVQCSSNALKACIDELKKALYKEDKLLDLYYAIYIIRCKDYYSSTVIKLLQKKGELYIYGAGTEAIKCLVELDKYNMYPKGFLVSDKQRNPAKLFGIPVYEIGDIEPDEKVNIWPCVINGREEILKILHDKGYWKIII